MNKILAFLKLIRLPNLFMIVIAQSVTAFKFVEIIDNVQVFYISLASIFIAIGGYILNDIEDLEVDKLNNKDLATNYFTVSTLKQLYYGFTVLGLSIAAYLSYNSKMWFIILFLFAYLLLWSYAKFFSQFKLIGNISISFLVAFTVLIVPIIGNVTNGTISSKEDIYIVVLPSYIILAFLFNWVREIVKDIEDREGDKQFGRVSIPIIFEVIDAKRIVYFFLFFASLLLVVQLYFLKIYSLVAVLVFMFLFIYQLNKSNSKEEFKKTSLLLKLTMFLGIIYPLFFN